MRHHKTKKALALILSLTIAAAVFTGCGMAGTGTAANTATSESPAAAVAEKADSTTGAVQDTAAEAMSETAAPEYEAEAVTMTAAPAAAAKTSANAPAAAAEVWEEPLYEEEADMYMVSAYAPEEEPYVELPAFNTEEYNYTEENRFLSPATAPFSTFAADVDTASYANFRRQVLDGGTVVPDSVRIEEMINYFHYDYPDPERGEPFSVTTELSDCPWNDEAKLLMIGLSAEQLDEKELPQSNLVFLIDVSGSMDEPNKLPLVQRSFMTLVENLDEHDRVSIVTYSSGERVVLDGTPADEKNTIMSAIESLEAYGSTNGEKALVTAYDLAKKNFIKGGNNRIIMATDGDFNVGITSEGDLTRLVQEKAQTGIWLSVLGYGMGNYKDNKLEALADNGKGNYAYIDSIDEARKVLVEEAGGTLFTVAKDVKLQVEFNPEKVKGYRLIGYENRTMAAEDFNNDKKDGGQIGAGHQVTALYELVLTDSSYEVPGVTSRYGSAAKSKAAAEDGREDAKEESEAAEAEDSEAEAAGIEDELLAVNIRYKEPEEDTSRLLVYPVTMESYREEMSSNMNWASGVAQAGMLLTESEYAGDSDFESIRARLRADADDDFKEEFIYLLRKVGK